MDLAIDANINQFPRTNGFTSPLKDVVLTITGCETPSSQYLLICRVELNRLPERIQKKTLYDMMGLETCYSESKVECFNHSATIHPIVLTMTQYLIIEGMVTACAIDRITLI